MQHSLMHIPDRKIREAVRILMLSPFYFKLSLADRKALIQEFCLLHANPPQQG
jgi:hypothetical protein